MLQRSPSSLAGNKYQLKGLRRKRVQYVLMGLGALLLLSYWALRDKLEEESRTRFHDPYDAIEGIVHKMHEGQSKDGQGLSQHNKDQKRQQIGTKDKEENNKDQKRRRKSDETGKRRRRKGNTELDKLLASNITVGIGEPIAGADDLSDYPADGFVRLPSLPPGPRKADDGLLHIIFSSGCNFFQHWQSELLLATAQAVGQRGRITRIVSGCHDKSAEKVLHTYKTFPRGKGDLLVPLHILNRSVNENYGLYITPSFQGAKDFPWINKPSSIRYFMEHARAELDRLGETVVAILDPDFVFMKSLTQAGEDPSDIIASRNQDKFPGINNPIDKVKLGRPVAQRYGLEGLWVNQFNVEDITKDPNSRANTYTTKEARRFTSVGPPLMLHVEDLAKLSVLWAEYMPRVLKVERGILADMWAYSIAAAHLSLEHTQLDHYMISAYGNAGQAYEFIDKWENMDCEDPKARFQDKLPVFIHMASSFRAPERKKGPWIFHKGHVPHDILSCSSPLHKIPPADLHTNTVEWKAKQQAWVLCHVIAKLNSVALDYKIKFCPNGYEKRPLVRHVDRKSEQEWCSKSTDKWCYPLAEIQGLPKGWRKTDEGFRREYTGDNK